MQRFRLVVAALPFVEEAQVGHGRQRGRVTVAVDALAGLKGFDGQRLRLVVPALVVVQDREVAQGIERGDRVAIHLDT